ncbi:Hypothetical predicted protein [Paramuricea clavata]|uniref:Uncharacterized protein n=1 Tax=Paramuricea clavata TaxID=317549 RepID=A0A6S7JCF9_PARCT|nr:Hypothetical predicted protein [Paramuricea clavata]
MVPKADLPCAIFVPQVGHQAGADKLSKSKKVLEAAGQGSIDYRVDANSNIALVRWLDNGLVKLVSSFVGIGNGNPVKRWSANKKIDVLCHQIVHEYNKHMEGVDLCDMLMALYCIKLRTRKWYMHIVYYCIGVAIVAIRKKCFAFAEVPK